VIVNVSYSGDLDKGEGLVRPLRRLSAPAGSSSEAAGVAAAHAMLVNLFPDQKASLDAAFADSLARITDGPAKTAGIAWRATSDADTPNTYRPFTTPGVYVPTTLPICSDWASHPPKTWLMQSASEFRPVPPPALTSTEWGTDYNEVKDLGVKSSSKRTSDQTEMARFWVDTGTESWDVIVRQLPGAPGRSLIQNARLFALVEMAEADGAIAACDAKFAFNFWPRSRLR